MPMSETGSATAINSSITRAASTAAAPRCADNRRRSNRDTYGFDIRSTGNNALPAVLPSSSIASVDSVAEPDWSRRLHRRLRQ